MDHIFTINKKLNKPLEYHKQNLFKRLEKSVFCTISSANVIAFSTECNIENNSSLWSSNVYIADLNSPWQIHRILNNSSPVTVLQWDFTGELLLIADESGCVRIYKSNEYLLNDWKLLWETILEGEHIIAAPFFHSGKKICLNSEKKDSGSYLEKFHHVKFACSVKQFGGRPANGALLLTTTGMLASILLPQQTTNHPTITITTESLAPTRIFVKSTDICYGKNGHFLIAVSNGDIAMPIQCYKVTVKKSGEKCIITSQSLLSFYLFQAPKEAPMEQILNEKNTHISNMKWIMREDADSLIVAVNSDKSSCLQVWELREKTIPVHKFFGNGGDTLKYFNTVLWQYQCHFQYNSKMTSLVTSKLSLLNNLSSGYLVVTFNDNTIHCLYRDTLKHVINNTTLNIYQKPFEEAKFQKTTIKIKYVDMSWLGNILLIIDSDDSLHLFKLPPQIESSTPLSVPYCTTILEYCMMSGYDWLDLLLVLRPGMLDALCDRLTESFNRQPPTVQQFFYVQYLCIKTSLYRLSAQGQSKANDLTHFLMLHSISTAFKSLLRPSEMSSQEKSPADSLASVISENQIDVDKVLMHLEPKDYTVEPSALQSLQQLIQWIADLALNLLIKLPDSRSTINTGNKPYELLKDIKALNMLREMLVLIRIWGLLRPACLPVFIKSDANLDVLALLFRLLSRLVQNINEPDDALIDDGCLLPSQVQIQLLQQINTRTVLASPQLSQQILPLQLEYNNDPEFLTLSLDVNTNQTVDSIRHLYLGGCPKLMKQCVRCGAAAGTVPVTRTAAIRAWDQRWIKSCQCGGLWRMQVSF